MTTMNAMTFGLLSCLLLAADPADAVPRLVAQLKEAKAEKRKEAAEDLGRLGADGKAALPALVAAFKDDDADVRKTAVEAVRFIGPDTKTALPALIDVLKT